MENSILKTIRSMLIEDDTITDFDPQLIVFINGALSKLYQAGIGDEKQFKISGEDETWSDMLTKDKYLEVIKEYIYLEVKMVFDPPSSSIVMEALKNMANEDYWRITTEIDMVGFANSSSSNDAIDYNNLINIPTLDGVELKGNVQMDLADKDYVNERIGDIENGYY